MRSVLVGVLFVGATVLPGAAELLSASAVPDGFELTSDPGVELDFATFAEQSPYSVGHVDANSADAAATTAALDVWVLGETDVLLREVAIWPTKEVAADFVGELAQYAGDLGLEPATAPFGGASAFSGSDPDAGVWVRMVVWTDGRVGVTVNHFTAGADEDPGSGNVDATANALRSQIDAAVSTASPSDPLADGGGGGSGETAASSGGGIPIVTVLVWLAIIGGAIWLLVKITRKVKAAKNGGQEPRRSRSKASEGNDPDGDGNREDDDVDDIIERARARGRAEREVEAIPDPTKEWIPPDDY